MVDGDQLDLTDSAKKLAEQGASKGGKAAAANMTPEERRDRARIASAARWARANEGDPELPMALCGSPDHPLRIGEIELPCYVLEDGRRVLVQRGMLTALDMSQGTAGRGGGDRIAKFISSKSVNPFIPKELSDVITKPVHFRTPTGGIAYGYEATVLADLCDAVLDARKRGTLNYQQEHIAERCEILVRGFARVGIIALVDEATGYQALRDRDALAKILERFLADDYAKWAKRFPDAFYREIFRLSGWRYSPLTVKRPVIIGKYTMNFVYDRLAPGLRRELERLNPKDDAGRRRVRHHQWLTDDIGHPKLQEHLAAVIALMRASATWAEFKRSINRALPKQPDIPLFERQEQPEVSSDSQGPNSGDAVMPA